MLKTQRLVNNWLLFDFWTIQFGALTQRQNARVNYASLMPCFISEILNLLEKKLTNIHLKH